MQIGVTFPQTDIEANPASIQRYAETVESLGYDHVLAYDHVLGVEPPHVDWDGPYDYTDQFIEPLVLFSHQAAVTTELQFVTGVLVLPQRETPLVAKQAATLDVLSDGRLVLGVGIGWNDLEYQNLGQSFDNRGARIEEQVEVLRALWQHDLVEYDGRWHQIDAAGINPLPVQRPIPVWMGGGADVVLRRIARQADGWVAPSTPIDEFEANLEALREYLQIEDRPAAGFPVHVRLPSGVHERDGWPALVQRFADLGVTHLGVHTMDLGLESVEDHLAVLTDVMDDLGDAGVR